MVGIPQNTPTDITKKHRIFAQHPERKWCSQSEGEQLNELDLEIHSQSMRKLDRLNSVISEQMHADRATSLHMLWVLRDSKAHHENILQALNTQMSPSS